MPPNSIKWATKDSTKVLAIDQQSLLDRADAVVVSQLPDVGFAHDLPSGNQEQPVGGVDSFRQSHSGLDFRKQNLPFLAMHNRLGPVAHKESDCFRIEA